MVTWDLLKPANWQTFIMDKNPLENIRNSNSVNIVIKNGVVYKADSLDEIHPEEKKATKFDWKSSRPENLPGVKN